PDQRGGMGMHYTSVTNIMKVIEPLFLNELYETLEKIESSATKLKKLQQRLGEVKIFDPACGSGNFLIIAYKELRKLEMEVLKCLQELEFEKTRQ
ncbi:MAG: DNA methyltransferase, partial [Porticoccus sp.]